MTREEVVGNVKRAIAVLLAAVVLTVGVNTFAAARTNWHLRHRVAVLEREVGILQMRIDYVEAQP